MQIKWWPPSGEVLMDVKDLKGLFYLIDFTIYRENMVGFIVLRRAKVVFR